jgi:hypothetical protein
MSSTIPSQRIPLQPLTLVMIVLGLFLKDGQDAMRSAQNVGRLGNGLWNHFSWIAASSPLFFTK